MELAGLGRLSAAGFWLYWSEASGWVDPKMFLSVKVRLLPVRSMLKLFGSSLRSRSIVKLGTLLTTSVSVPSTLQFLFENVKLFKHGFFREIKLSLNSEKLP